MRVFLSVWRQCGRPGALAPCPLRGQALPSPRSRVTARPCRAKALALERPLLMGCVNLDKLLSLSEPPFPHMLNASQGSSDPS